jgi:hypothetical protein
MPPPDGHNAADGPDLAARRAIRAIGQTVAGVGGGALARTSEAAPFLVLAGLYGLAALGARTLASR